MRKNTKMGELEVVVSLHSEDFVKQLGKVQREFEKLANTELRFSIEREDEPLLSVIKRKIQKRLVKLNKEE